ncbi:hypothetical protein [Oscillibacter sp.]
MKKAQTIPWLEIEERYVALFTKRKGVSASDKMQENAGQKM